MDLKLQQAIVATKAGRTDISQDLLTQLIQADPNDANAWFLLGHLVDSPERQSLYLRKTLELEPDHVIAKQRLNQLANQPVPAPVLPEQSGRTNASDEISADHRTVESPGIDETRVGLQDLQDDKLDGKTIDEEDWQELDSEPMRETRSNSKAAPPPIVPKPADPRFEPSRKQSSGDIWLIRILVIMVIIASIVLAILVLLLLI